MASLSGRHFIIQSVEAQISDEVPDEQITIYSGMAPDGHAVECTFSTNSIKWLQYKDRQFIRNFPGCIINGGRLYCGKNTAVNMLLMLTRITEEGLIPRLTFTNMLLHPEHFEDEYSNMILESAKEYHGQVIVNSDELGEYIFNRYHLPLILSTARMLSNENELNLMLDRYSMVVLDYNHNKDDEYLRKVKDPSRLEVMPNELCAPGCTKRQKHYEHLSRCQLENKAIEFVCPCERENKGFTVRTKNFSHTP